MPALTIYRHLKTHIENAEFISLGSKNGIERDLFTKEGVPYQSISTGKLRRYFSWENFVDILRILNGTIQSFLFMLPFSKKETVVISTGGFVSVPVVVAAWLQGKKIVVHEQTTRVGLANKIASKFANEVIVSFEESLKFFPPEKTKALGYPLRTEIFETSEEEVVVKGMSIKATGRPLLFLTGGGNGSKLLNDALTEIMPKVQDKFCIVHQCGKDFVNDLERSETETYKVLGFVGKEMIQLMKEASVVISRSGAGTVVELMALGKPSIYIPLKIAQKNEQFHNAMEAKEKVGSLVIEEDQLSGETLLAAIEEIEKKDKKKGAHKNPTEDICKLISEV